MGGPRHRGGHGSDAAPQLLPSSAGSFFGGGGYASHGAYMVEKNRKLKEQLAANFSTGSSTGSRSAGVSAAPQAQIFRGLSFWMTGRTCVADHELKRMIVEHGGIYEQYGFTRVSHIIADNLAIGNQTWRELRKRIKRGHVVTSSWVVDCTREQRRLAETRYMPDCLSTGSTMMSFLSMAAGTSQANAAPSGSSASSSTSVVQVMQLDDAKQMPDVASCVENGVAAQSPLAAAFSAGSAVSSKTAPPTDSWKLHGTVTDKAPQLKVNSRLAAAFSAGASVLTKAPQLENSPVQTIAVDSEQSSTEKCIRQRPAICLDVEQNAAKKHPLETGARLPPRKRWRSLQPPGTPRAPQPPGPSDVVRQAFTAAEEPATRAWVEDFRLLCKGGSRGAKDLLQLASGVTEPDAFHRIAAGVWALLRRRELDVVAVALRSLQVAAAGGTAQALLFNGLLQEVNSVLVSELHVARLDVAPLEVVKKSQQSNSSVGSEIWG